RRRSLQPRVHSRPRRHRRTRGLPQRAVAGTGPDKGEEMSILDLAGNILAVFGSLVFASAALGLVRFPDTYTRLSAVGAAGGLGIILIVTGVVLYDPSPTGFILLLLIIGLQLSASSIGSIAIGRSAY